jgi:hypothetical protein
MLFGRYLCLAASTLVRADTLVMRDGRRVPGHLVGIRVHEVEFDGELGRFFFIGADPGPPGTGLQPPASGLVSRPRARYNSAIP